MDQLPEGLCGLLLLTYEPNWMISDRWRRLSNLLSNFHPQSNGSPRVEEGGPQPGVSQITKGLLHLQGTMKASVHSGFRVTNTTQKTASILSHLYMPSPQNSQRRLTKFSSLRNTKGICGGERNRIHLPVRTSVHEHSGDAEQRSQQLVMAVYTCDPSTQRAKAEDWVWV